VFLPIESASIADGIIVLDFNRKTIQHLEGGIIDQIMVKEGQDVNEGEILLYLHDIKAKTEQQILKERLWTMQLQRERLAAEKENKPELNLNDYFAQIGELPENDNNKLQIFRTNHVSSVRAQNLIIRQDNKVRTNVIR
jgi:multidrug efflux pump subunit AcrA (membrane-fusion protein)